tara:strand:- start:125 stop:349 length:225 start_codon:yes stop_codon:yes gene_type:complete
MNSARLPLKKATSQDPLLTELKILKIKVPEAEMPVSPANERMQNNLFRAFRGLYPDYGAIYLDVFSQQVRIGVR